MSLAIANRQERRERLFLALADEYMRRFPISHALQESASRRLVDGGSHTARLFPPHPNWIRSAKGPHVADADGNTIVDLWQGHLANILGHNPPAITRVLAETLAAGQGLQTGMQEPLEAELAELICRLTGTESIRFTTSGSLATMYAILVARAFTGRELVLKVGGGWHGSHPWGLVAVSHRESGYTGLESEGLPASVEREVLVTPFNDATALEKVFYSHGDRIACFIVEPFLGGGGLIAARPEFLRRARELTARYGALLVFDEIISGFRFHAGPLGTLYGVEPDLMTLGKIIGGGMPVAAVAGRRDVLRIAGREGGRKARFEGGTYSAHPLSLRAGFTMLKILADQSKDIYPAIAAMGHRLRTNLPKIFEAEGIIARCTGDSSLPKMGSSLLSLNFPYDPSAAMDSPEVVNDPRQCDVDLRERILKVAFLLEGVYVIHAGGAISVAHREDDIVCIEEAARAVARRLRAAGLDESG